MKPNLIVAPKKQGKQALTCDFCGHQGEDVRPHDYRDLSGHDSIKDICTDYSACQARQLQRMVEIDREIEIRMGNSKYLAECRRILALEG